MATFKVGQRVRMLPVDGDPRFAGKEATVACIPSTCKEFDCSVLIDGYDPRVKGFLQPTVATFFRYLAPLTDPRAETFIADMERFSRLAKEPLPLPAGFLASIKGGA